MCKPRRIEIIHTVQAWIRIEKSTLILQNCIFTKGFFYSSTALRHNFTFLMRDVRAVGLPQHFNPFLAKVEEVRQNLKELLCTSFWDPEADIIWTSPADFQTNKQSLSSSFLFFCHRLSLDKRFFLTKQRKNLICHKKVLLWRCMSTPQFCLKRVPLFLFLFFPFLSFLLTVMFSDVEGNSMVNGLKLITAFLVILTTQRAFTHPHASVDQYTDE